MNPLDDFLKEASWLDAIKTVGGAAREQVSRAMPNIIAGLGIGGGMAAAGFGVKKIQEHFGKQRDYKAMLEANPHLEKMDAGQVQMTYNSLRKAAPTLAADPLMAGSFVRKTLEMSDPPYVDPQTVKMLTDAQKNISQGRASGHPFRDVAMAIASRPMMEEQPPKPLLVREDQYEFQRLPDVEGGGPIMRHTGYKTKKYE